MRARSVPFPYKGRVRERVSAAVMLETSRGW